MSERPGCSSDSTSVFHASRLSGASTLLEFNSHNLIIDNVCSPDRAMFATERCVDT